MRYKAINMTTVYAAHANSITIIEMKTNKSELQPKVPTDSYTSYCSCSAAEMIRKYIC